MSLLAERNINRTNGQVVRVGTNPFLIGHFLVPHS